MTSFIEEKLIEHIVNTSFSDFNAETVSSCKKLIIDSVGVMFPGSQAPGCPETAALARSWPCTSGSSVLIHGFSTTPPMAAMVNSTMMHALDFDDTLDDSALHTCVTTLPAALSVAEKQDAVSGKDLIAAVCLGADIICRLSLAIDRPLSWIRTATCGGFGAAATAAKIMGLTGEQTWNALGIVYSQTSGNAQGLLEGRLAKRLQPGFAASAGVLAAYLARQGITGSHKFLTGKYGFYSLYEHGSYHPERILDRIEDHCTINDLSIKPYPSCRMTHSSIDAGIALRKYINAWEDIEKVEIAVSPMVAEMVGKPFHIGANPQVDAQFSIPYTISCAIIRGDVFLSDFETDQIYDLAVRKLAERVFVFADYTLPEKDIFQSNMTIKNADGQKLSEHVSMPRGNPQNPMSYEQCIEKFHKCIEYSGLSISSTDRDTVVSMIEDLEYVSSVSELISKINDLSL
jgi:2-methylcitrate dehydratase PrpD